MILLLPHLSILLLLLLSGVFSSSFDINTTVSVVTPETKLTVNQSSSLTIQLDRLTDEDLVFNCTPSSETRISLDNGNIITVRNATNHTTVGITAGVKGGTCYLSTVMIEPTGLGLNITDLDMSVVHSKPMEIFIAILGWICFAMWSLSFYPQIFKNWKRKSVVGLSFDFLGYNTLGWICYTVFNMSLLWVEPVKRQYYETYPHGVINVQISDFCFSAHALVLTLLTIVQCLIYDRGGQTPSFLCKVIFGAVLSAMVILLIVTASCCMTWFQYVSLFSYVKLAVTLFKYSPQVYVNFKNKSTEAIAISVFLLDAGGGLTSLLQMALIAWNYDDWKTFIGDFTKFGLAVLSILYDLIFIVQHYCLYRQDTGTSKDSNEKEEGDRAPLLSGT